MIRPMRCACPPLPDAFSCYLGGMTHFRLEGRSREVVSETLLRV